MQAKIVNLHGRKNACKKFSLRINTSEKNSTIHVKNYNI
jgi:hypothetical protein